MQANQLYMNSGTLNGDGYTRFTSVDNESIDYDSWDFFRILEINEDSVKIEHQQVSRCSQSYRYSETFTVTKNTCQEMINCSNLQKE